MSEETNADAQTEEPLKEKKRRIPLFIWVLLAVVIWVVLFIWITDTKNENPENTEQAPVTQQESVSEAVPAAEPVTEETAEAPSTPEATTAPAQENATPDSSDQSTVAPQPQETPAPAGNEATTDATEKPAAEQAAPAATEVPPQVMQQLNDLFSTR